MNHYIDQHLNRPNVHRESVEEDIDDAREIAKKGVEFLNNHFGDNDWIDRIEPESLAMESCYQCALGQLFGSYMKGEDILGEEMPIEAFDYIKVNAHALTVAWLEQLTNERYESEPILS